MPTTTESSALEARSTPLPGAVNWRRLAAEDVEDGFVGIPTRAPRFARWMPALYVGAVVPSCKSTPARLKALPLVERLWKNSSRDVRQETVA